MWWCFAQDRGSGDSSSSMATSDRTSDSSDSDHKRQKQNKMEVDKKIHNHPYAKQGVIDYSSINFKRVPSWTLLITTECHLGLFGYSCIHLVAMLFSIKMTLKSFTLELGYLFLNVQLSVTIFSFQFTSYFINKTFRLKLVVVVVTNPVILCCQCGVGQPWKPSASFVIQFQYVKTRGYPSPG